MNIEFKRLTEVNRSEIVALMNNPRVRQHMPLSKETFDEVECDRFIADKERLWLHHGYGPWAFFVDGRFVGWGGFQPEHGAADLGLVLDPGYWGIGRLLYRELIALAFGELGFDSVTVLLPLTRARTRGLLRLGFKEADELVLDGERFIRYRLDKQASI